jgi:hypothetical protein
VDVESFLDAGVVVLGAFGRAEGATWERGAVPRDDAVGDRDLVARETDHSLDGVETLLESDDRDVAERGRRPLATGAIGEGEEEAVGALVDHDAIAILIGRCHRRSGDLERFDACDADAHEKSHAHAAEDGDADDDQQPRWDTALLLHGLHGRARRV